jgi:hypothetical protein
MDFIKEIDDWRCVTYKVKSKIESQTIEIWFQDSGVSPNKCWWNIYLHIYSKRKDRDKQIDKCSITGKIGLKGLIFAKEAICEFERYIIDEQPKIIHYIYCYWLDNKRRDIYHYGLSKIGYHYGQYLGKKVLFKQISD